MKRQMKITLLAVLLAGNLLFIWGNSLLPASASSELSGGLLEMLGWVGVIAEKVLRKLAHFSEFACLGLLLCLLFHTFDSRSLSAPLLCGILAAMVDETIQLGVPGRSAAVLDVWIDTAGVTTGVAMALFALWLIRKHKLKSGGNSK